MSRRAVFLDRDGTLIEEAGYLDRLERLVFYPYTVDAVRVLNRTGFAVVVVSNQAGVARGIVEESFVGEAHRHIAARLEAGGARIDRFYYCPHHRNGSVQPYARDCDCRKPEPGLLRRAQEELDLDLSRSFMVGDRWHDIQAGKAVGARSMLLRSGVGRIEEASPPPGLVPDAVVDTLMDAAAWILQHA